MKKLKFVFFVVVGVFTFFPILAFAGSITNNSGIEISEEEYENFLLVHTPEYIMAMDEETYEKLKTLDYTNVVKQKIYVETTYNRNLAIVTERELSEEEYEKFNSSIESINPGSYGVTYESTAKCLDMAFAAISGSSYSYVTLAASWKYIPNVRSFDVIGFRGYGFNFRNGSQQGKQIYLLNGNYTMINYSWNGTNIKKFDNGFGISMNIVNSDIDDLVLEIEADVQATIDHPEIFGSYQHAVSNLSLANSQNYTLGGGLGDVFVYPYNISVKYDGMVGVSLTF